MLEGCVDRAEIPALCAQVRRLLALHGVDEVICELAGLVRSDLVAVDALARMQLTARRAGGLIRLRGARPELLELFGLLCLRRVLPNEDGDDP